MCGFPNEVVSPFKPWPLQRQKAPENEQPYVDKLRLEDRRAIEQKLRLTVILCSTCSEAAQMACLSLSFPLQIVVSAQVA